MRAAATSGDTLVDFDPLDPSTYDRLAPRTLFANYIFAAMAGVIWYFQFFFYSMGQTKMGKYDFSSWTLHMASIIIFATLWGLVLKEWHGTSMRTKLLVTAGLLLLVGSTVIVGYGNYLHAVFGNLAGQRQTLSPIQRGTRIGVAFRYARKILNGKLLSKRDCSSSTAR